MNDTTEFFDGKRILVTGACGTIGRELIRQLLVEYQVDELLGIDNNESDLFFLEQQFLNYSSARFVLSDVRDRQSLVGLMNGMDIVFHAAAFKHVILCERSPVEAVQTNILGVQNVVSTACESNVQLLIFTSSDKAVNPTNVMGTSKLMGERLVTAANAGLRESSKYYASTRFGNVMGSRGSVIPIFKEQIRRGGPVTLTHPDMTRFIMSTRQAVALVIDSAVLARGGEVFVTKMPVIRIKDLAEIMIQELAPVYGHTPGDLVIETIGTKPGEKMYEELMSMEETRRSIELEKYFVVTPAFTNIYRNIDYHYPGIISDTVTNPYHSGNETVLTKSQLKTFLKDNDLLFETAPVEPHPAERYFP